MANALEALVRLNKNFIMNSKFQNTIFEGKKLYEYLQEKQTTLKAGESLQSLILHLIDKLPAISYESVMKYRAIYEKYPDLYLRFVGDHNYLVQIQAFLAHADRYKDADEVPVSFSLPSFFSRSYKIIFLNKKSGEQKIRAYPTHKNGKPNVEANDVFLYLVYSGKTYEEILTATDWAKYAAIMGDLAQGG